MGIKKLNRLIVIIALASLIVACSEEIEEPVVEVKQEVQVEQKVYTDGKYLVGDTIDKGIYRAKVVENEMGIGYIERSADEEMSMDGILANIMLAHDGYVEIKGTDVGVYLEGVELTKIDDLVKDIKTEVRGGIHLVGYDIEPGVYEVELINPLDKGTFQTMSSVTMDPEDLMTNETIEEPLKIEIKTDVYAIRTRGLVIRKADI